MSNTLPKLSYYLALATAPSIGPTRFRLLTEHFGSAEKVWNLKASDLVKILGQKTAENFLNYREKTDPDELLSEAREKGIQVIADYDRVYPKLLKQIKDSPTILFVQGELKKEDEKALAVVGSRKVTAYGREVTEKITRDLVEEGFTIVSGLAKGVDSLAHKTALENGGRTIAVLGGGLSRIYPPENIKLAQQITQNGALISEYPPETPPIPGNFPARNRIISGLSSGVLVTEAGEDSGSLITANFALEQNREVFAVPGPIYSKLAAGPASLIKEGAKLVTGVNDILEELNLPEAKARSKEFKEIKGDNLEEQLIIDLLAAGESHVDRIVRKSKLPVNQVSSLLSILEIKGKIKSLGNGNFSLKS